MKDLSVIIVNYKAGERLTKCLTSLQNIKGNRFSFEVVVVDNQSCDGSQDELKRLFPQYTFITNSGNNGFANGCNLGAAKSTGSNLLFLNPDTIVTDDALFDMLEEVRVRPEYSIVSCGQVREDGSKDRPYGKFLTFFTLAGWQRTMHRLYFGKMEDLISQTKHYIYPDWVSGSVIMIRRSSFYSLGQWDDDFWMYFEDVDLCHRAKLRNGEIVKLKHSVIGHIHGASSRINPQITALTKTEVQISRHYYISKYEKYWWASCMHSLLILDSMLFGLLPALLGFLLFFVKKLNVYSHIYLRLVKYYLSVLKSGRWISERSVNYAVKHKEPVADHDISLPKQFKHQIQQGY